MSILDREESQAGQQVYTAERDPHSTEKLRLAGEIRRAAARGELVPYFQPKVDLATGLVDGVEALVRWRHPRRGVLLPCDFVPLAERAGHIGALTEVVVEAALDLARRTRAQGQELRVAVNLSARSLLDERIVTEVRRGLDSSGVPGRLLQLELTESMLVADPRRARQVMDQLRAMGVSLSLDDFGTGYSSLTQLAELPVDELKVDRSFIERLEHDDRTAIAIVRSTVALAHELGLRVIAEGVESRRVLDLLTALGCDAVQGFLLAVPVPAEDLAAAIRVAELTLGDTTLERAA